MGVIHTAPPNFPSTAEQGSCSTLPEPASDDRALLAAAAAGDTGALEQMWLRYQRLVRSVIHRALGPDGEAEDLTQEVFLALLRGAKNIREAAALRGYLRGSALRIAAQELRRRRRLRGREELSASGVLPEAEAPARDAVEREALAALLRVFSKLKPRQREAFLLRSLHRLGWQEIAAELSISESTAKRDVVSVRVALRRSLPREPALIDYVTPGAKRCSLLRRISIPLSAMPNTSASVSYTEPSWPHTGNSTTPSACSP